VRFAFLTSKSLSLQYPYPNEQVGKANLDIPPHVLDGPLIYDNILNPGDVLYMPRGFVHEAHTLDKECSFHVTIALPTMDWTLAGAVTAATEQALSQVIENRMALPLSLFTNNGQSAANNNTNGNVEFLQQQLDDAMQRIRQQVTVDTIVHGMRQKTEKHNTRALKKRMTIIQRQASQQNSIGDSSLIVGEEAAATVSLDTVVRASTEAEKAQVIIQQARGLNVREDVADTLLGVVQKLRADPSLSCRVADLLSLLKGESEEVQTAAANKICQLTLLCFARCCVELGAMAIIR